MTHAPKYRSISQRGRIRQRTIVCHGYLLSQKHVEPGEDCEYDGCGEHGIAAAIGAADVETVARIPNEMPDAAAEMIEEGDRPTEQQQQSNRGNEEGVSRCENVAAGS